MPRGTLNPPVFTQVFGNPTWNAEFLQVVNTVSTLVGGARRAAGMQGLIDDGSQWDSSTPQPDTPASQPASPPVGVGVVATVPTSDGGIGDKVLLASLIIAGAIIVSSGKLDHWF